MEPDKWFDQNDANIHQLYAGKSRFWHSNRTPKSIRVQRFVLHDECFYHKMSEFDFPMRSLYCWDLSKQHKHYFNQNYQRVQIKV